MWIINKIYVIINYMLIINIINVYKIIYMRGSTVLNTPDYKKTRHIALLAVFVAIIIIQTVVPFLGFIPLGVINATIIHITVIVATILLGLKSGMFLGFVFGLSSLLKNTFAPGLVSFCFSPFVPNGNIKSVFVSIVPRIMIAVVSYYVYKLFDKYMNSNIALVLTGAIGSISNTVLVLGSIYLLFGKEYATVTNTGMGVLIYSILGIVGTNGVAEAIVSAVITYGLTSVLKKVY